MKVKYYTFFFLTGLFLAACKKDEPAAVPVDFGYNYFPEEVGRYVIYDIDSIHYDDHFGAPDTVRYRLKERIASLFTDNSGRPSMRIERFVKPYDKNLPYDSIQWSVPRVWSSTRTTTTAEKKEENVIFLKLVFPVKEKKEWNGNAYNSLGEKTYEIISLDENEKVNNLTFDSVLTVKQFDQTDFIQIRYEAEKYARNVGLVYKQRDSIYHGGDMVTGKVGYKFTQKIVSYGK